jgi:hypothetical protein
VCILAKGSGDCASPAYHDHPPQRLLQNFPDTTRELLCPTPPIINRWGRNAALARSAGE